MKISATLSLCILMLCIYLYSCSNEQKSIAQQGGLYLNDSIKKIVTLDTVHQRIFIDELELNGAVSFDKTKLANIAPILGGTIMEVKANIGDYVSKGAVLATIKSSEVAEYEKQLVEADQELLVAKRNLNAVEDQYKAGMVADLDMVKAKHDVQNAQAEQNSIKETFALYNMDKSYYQIKAPIAGFITDCKITQSMQLRSDQNDPVFTICGLNNVWIMADVYQTDINKIKVADEVFITTLAYPNKIFKGVVDKIYNVLDDVSKTMSIRIKLQNQDYLLKPGMFATVIVNCSQSKEPMAFIEKHAIIFDMGKNYVVAVGDSNKLEIKEVSIYKQQHSGIVYISKGIHANDIIINDNALLIYNALKEQR